uniref:Radical SAM core domain-containing protein n=1 Tax=Ditylum brightwellii TaxID=49249 RepID=A0A7S4S4Z6_9STRA
MYFPFQKVIIPFIVMSCFHRTTRSKIYMGVASAFTSSSSPSRMRTSSSFLLQWQRLQSQQKSTSSFTQTKQISATTTLLHQAAATTTAAAQTQQPPLKINLHTITLDELEQFLISLKQPKYRAKQVMSWIRDKGITDVDQMTNLPKNLIQLLKEYTVAGSLELVEEKISTDGTRKRAYRLFDGQLIESVLMPYEDGRNTACISSQAGCAMGCVFCATGQMGFARQLTPEEIFEQVSIFASELKSQNDDRLTNVVMMGMGEPLANYRNVMSAIKRMNSDLGIGARKITVSTVGVVPNIRKLYQKHENEEDNVPQVRLAVSLHCATDEERTALLPANRRYGGLDELLTTVKEYIDVTKRRVTFEWALIENQNDTPDVARTLGRVLRRHNIRRDMVHINLIPLNPTGGFGSGRPSGKANVEAFVKVLEDEFSIKATPRMRRGIDIEAGCGQLKAVVKKKEEAAEQKRKESISAASAAVDELQSFMDQGRQQNPSPLVGVYEDDEDDEIEEVTSSLTTNINQDLRHGSIVNFDICETAVSLDDDEDDFLDPTYQTKDELDEAQRLINLVTNSFPTPPAAATATPQKSKKQQQKDQTQRLINIVANSFPPPPAAAAATPQTSKKQQQDQTKTTSITDEDAMREARRKRKKLLKNLKAIEKLREMESDGKILNEEQLTKIAKEEEWRAEVESLEHNLK